MQDYLDARSKHRLTVEEFLLLDREGAFGDRRTELFEGEVYYMSPKHRPHARAVTELVVTFAKALEGSELSVLSDISVRLSDHDVPEPDIAVVTGSPRDYRTGHPATAALVIEVSDATLDLDRRTKLPLYAAANVPEYWIVNVADRRLEVFRTPANLPAPSYTQSLVLSPTDSISPLAAPHATIAVTNLLP